MMLIIVALLLTVFLEVAFPICAGEQSNSLLVSRATSNCAVLCCKAFLSSMVHATTTLVGRRLGSETDCVSGSWTRTLEV